MIWLLAISAAVRAVVAAHVEFGNDEVYYWAYAMYPDWSHFDHPPMVGWVIQLFSLNLLFDSELFIRLASVVLMTVNTWLMYLIGKEAKDARAGFFAALLYTASIYAFIITGIFIMPDTPLSLFWLLAFWMAIRYLKADHPEGKHILLTGLFAGLAVLSKYSGAFIWVGVLLYLLLYDRKRFRDPKLYLAMLITALCCLPILYWNLKNDFASFSFHGERVSLFGKPNLNTLGTEVAGEFFYNNPVNYVLAIIATVAAFRGKLKMDPSIQRLVLCTALPMIGLFLFFSLTRPTLPHWNAPGFVMLIILSACMIRNYKPVIGALTVLVLVLGIGVAQINTGFITLDHHTEPERLGRDDFSLDMFGWRQLETKFAALRESKIAEGVMKEDDGIVADEWFPLSNLDYYVAQPLGMRAMGLGGVERIHKYAWINKERGGLHHGEDYWFLYDTRYPRDPSNLFPGQFQSIEFVGVIPIERGGRTAKNFFVYACKNLQQTKDPD